MSRTVIILNAPTFKLANDEAGLATGDAYECQITSAVITAQPQFNTIPATGCAGATQSPGRTGYQLDLAWLQDWTDSGGGLSGYAYENDGTSKWFELVPDSTQPTVKATGQVYVVSGGMGGAFGDGSAAATTATWPCVDKPSITVPV